MKLVNWNIEWKKKSSFEGRELLKRIFSHNPEIICITEGFSDIFSETGYTITSEEDFGYPGPKGGRKVILWSKNPWSEIDSFGNNELPTGRYVSGFTETSLGKLYIIGVCIPFGMAHVSSGQKNRKPWQDHSSYLDGLSKIISDNEQTSLIVMGDFNQRIPRKFTPFVIYEKLINSFPSNMIIGTSGKITTFPKLTIDHIVHSNDIKIDDLCSISNKRDDSSKKLTDHIGISAVLIRCKF